MSMKEPWSLAGKMVLLSAGTKGIGRAMVEELAGNRVRVQTCARSDVDVQEQVRGWYTNVDAGLTGRLRGSAYNISMRADIDRERLVATASAELGGKRDILVNNTGHAFLWLAT